MESKTTKIRGLVCKAANGNQDAWTELYHASFREAYFVATKVSGEAQDATDLVQDAYITAFQKIEQLEDPEKFQSWLNMIVANKCRDYLRKNKPLLFVEMQTEDGADPEWEDDREYGQPEMTFDHEETVRLIAEIIEGLPEDQRLCVTLYYHDELSVGEIAQVLEVSEGTVKSRLNYARKKVKTKVEDLEKKGVKLYGLAPLPLLAWLLKTEASAVEIPASAMVAPAVTSAAEAVTAAVETGATTATTAAVGTGSKVVASGLIGKVIAGIAALSVAVGGIVVYNNSQDKADVPPVSEIVESQTPETQPIDPAKEAITRYEELLSIGNTESGLKIAYFAYVDLDHDEIPELLVSDADGTPDSWSTCEVYTYQDSSLHLCGHTNSRYDYFYLANDSYILGKHRMGHQFISTTEFISTTIYHWNEDDTRNDPAIFYGNGDWEYITMEEFNSYQVMPGEEGSEKGFIKSAEPITLEKNISAQPDLVEKYLSYDDAWGFFASIDGNDLYYLSMVFNEYGRMDSVLSFAMDNQPIEPMGYYKGSYIAFKDTFTIQLETDGNSYIYQFDPETYILTQISEFGIFKTHKPGDTFTLVKDEWNDAEKILDLVERNYKDY